MEECDTGRSARESSGLSQAGFQRFADGAILDLVRDPKRGVELILYRDGKIQTGCQLEYEGRVWVPPAHPILDSMRLPRRFGNISPTFDDLLQGVKGFLETYVDFAAERDAGAASLFALATWFQHRTATAPYLSVTGVPGSGKTKLARCLSLICRRALFLCDLTPAALSSIPMHLSPTLILDEVKMTDDLVRRLRAGSSREGYLLGKGGERIDVFGPKVIVTQAPLADPALGSRALRIDMTPTSRNMPELTLFDIEFFEKTLVPKLLRYSIENYDQQGEVWIWSMLDPSCLSPHQRDVAHSLAASYSSPFGQQTVVDLLQPQDENISSERFFTREASVVEAIAIQFIDPKRQLVYVGQLAALANSFLESQGERLRLSPKAVGVILHRLGYRTLPIGNLGRGLWLSEAVKKMTYNLARHYGVFIVPPQRASAPDATSSAQQHPAKAGKEEEKLPKSRIPGARNRTARRHVPNRRQQ